MCPLGAPDTCISSGCHEILSNILVCLPGLLAARGMRKYCFFFFFCSAQLPLPIFVYVHFSRCTFSSRFSPHLHLFVLRYFRAAVFYFLQFYVPPPPPPRPANKLMISCVAMWWPRKCIFHTFAFVHDIKVLNLTTSQMPAWWFFVSLALFQYSLPFWRHLTLANTCELCQVR